MDLSASEEEETTSTSNSDEETTSSLTTLDSEEEPTSSSFTVSDDDDVSELFSHITRATFESTYREQCFSLPDPIMEYILKNPSSPEVYQKLTESCKFFFLKNPIVVVPYVVFKNGGMFVNFGQSHISMDNFSSKFWITDTIFIDNTSPNYNHQQFSNYVVPKIFQCDNKRIDVRAQNISINDLMLMGPKCEKLSLNWGNVIVDDDGVAVPCEKLVASFPQLIDFTYAFVPEECASKIFSTETVQELLTIPHFATLKNLYLDVPQTFDIQRFYEDYIKKNKTTKIRLTFLSDNLPPEYRILLQNIVNEIVGAVNHDYIIPNINFTGIEETSFKKLLVLFNQ